MSDKKTPMIEAAVPVLSVNDLEGTLQYYEKALGFHRGWAWGDPPHLASISRDRVEVNLRERGRAGPPSTSRVYFQMSGVDAYYDDVVRAGATITAPLEDRPYGMRDFGLQDPRVETSCTSEKKRADGFARIIRSERAGEPAD